MDGMRREAQLRLLVSEILRVYITVAEAATRAASRHTDIPLIAAVVAGNQAMTTIIEQYDPETMAQAREIVALERTLEKGAQP